MNIILNTVPTYYLYLIGTTVFDKVEDILKATNKSYRIYRLRPSYLFSFLIYFFSSIILGKLFPFRIGLNPGNLTVSMTKYVTTKVEDCTLFVCWVRGKQ